MRRFLFRFGLFLCLWLEVAAEFHLSGDVALMLSVVVWLICKFAVRIAGYVLSLLGPTVFKLLLQCGLWAGLFWWRAPASLVMQPVWMTGSGVGLLILLGGACRRGFEHERRRYGRNVLRAHSGAVVVGILGFLALCMISMTRFHSLWPLVGDVLLVGLPFSVGWKFVPLSLRSRPDAKVGDAKSFRHAGLSEER